MSSDSESDRSDTSSESEDSDAFEDQPRTKAPITRDASFSVTPSASKSSGSTKEKSKPQRIEKRAGLVWPVQRTYKSIKGHLPADRSGLSMNVAISHSAALQCITEDVLAEAMQRVLNEKSGRRRVGVSHIIGACAPEIRDLARFTDRTVVPNSSRVLHGGQYSYVDERLKIKTKRKRSSKKSAASKRVSITAL
jgi:hypothetical protein